MKRFLFFAYRDWAINIFKNINISEDEFVLLTSRDLCSITFINNIKPDVIFFYGWSWLVPSNIINNYTCLCLHPSNLPKYRGGSPIQNQIISGENISAVSIFKMGDELDAGPIFFQESFSLSGYLSKIFDKIEVLGVKGTKQFINDFKNNNVKYIEQNEQYATIYKRLKPFNSEIRLEDFLNYDAEYFYNKVRSLQKPYPECYVKCKNGKIILKEVSYEQ